AFAVVALFLLLGFFLAHQSQNTGYFTEKFRAIEMFALYAPLMLGFAAPAVRALTGSRNVARPYEAATSLLLALGSLWLLTRFPFDYTHLPDVLPAGLRFILAWVTDDIARIVLLLQVIVGPITAVIALVTYFSRRRETQPAVRRGAW
ncbi:MAG: hypothetical protein JNJ61_18895, partial [Anaerolineae bacterium]|nr:hypothetical protein [Anaerolineae bacterium]